MKKKIFITSLIFSLFIGLFTQAQEKEKSQSRKDSIRAAKIKKKYPVKTDTVYGEVMKYVDATPGSHEGLIQRS
jgi:hypothetical protein